MAGITDEGDFVELADEVSGLAEEAPEAMDRGIEKTARELRRVILHKIDQANTSKGGTFDSDTSPYTTGGGNDSTQKKGKLSNKRSWKISEIPVTSSKTNAYMLSPKKPIRYRAKVFEEGTPGASGDDVGDKPMWFKINGPQGTIVVSDVPPRKENGDPIPLAAQFDGEPMSVEGVEGNYGITEAVEEFRQSNRLEDNVEKEVNKATGKLDQLKSGIKGIFS